MGIPDELGPGPDPLSQAASCVCQTPPRSPGSCPDGILRHRPRVCKGLHAGLAHAPSRPPWGWKVHSSSGAAHTLCLACLACQASWAWDRGNSRDGGSPNTPSSLGALAPNSSAGRSRRGNPSQAAFRSRSWRRKSSPCNIPRLLKLVVLKISMNPCFELQCLCWKRHVCFGDLGLALIGVHFEIPVRKAQALICNRLIDMCAICIYTFKYPLHLRWPSLLFAFHWESSTAMLHPERISDPMVMQVVSPSSARSWGSWWREQHPKLVELVLSNWSEGHSLVALIRIKAST